MNKEEAKGHLSMLAARTLAGWNSNALKYVLPIWIAPFTCVAFRLYFASIIFWIIGLFIKSEPKTTAKQKFEMFILGALGVFGFMTFYTWGLSHTPPVSCTIIISLIPIWVFIILLCMGHEKLDWLKSVGLTLGILGVCINIFTKKAPQYADNPLLGDILSLCSSIIYAFYLSFATTSDVFMSFGCSSLLADEIGRAHV